MTGLVRFVATGALVVLWSCGGTKTGGPVVEPGELTWEPTEFVPEYEAYAGDTVSAEQGRLVVPERHGEADESRRIALRLVRFASTSETPGFPVVYLAGGPGGSGVVSARGDRFPFFMALRRAGDVIALDQRGTYSADPYPRCEGTWSYPLDRPLVDSVASRVRGEFLRRCWQRWAETVDPTAYTTPPAADDLEALRLALGVEKLSLVGISYGTHLALSYIRRHPDRVAAAVLAGVEGPDHTYKLPSAVDGIVREIDRVLWADGGPGFVAALETALARLSDPETVELRHPETGEAVPVTVGAQDLRQAVYFDLDERSSFAVTAERIRAIAEGRTEVLARYAAFSRQGLEESVMPLSADCAAGATEERRRRIVAEAGDALLGDVGNLSLRSACPAWPVEDLGDGYRSPIRSDVPVLAVSGSIDLRTPPSNAREVLAGLSRGRHLILEGAGHDDDLLIGSPRIAEEFVSFLTTGRTSTERLSLR